MPNVSVFDMNGKKVSDLALAEGTAKEATLFDPIYPERWPIMDTMADTVLNAIGAVAG